MPLEHNLSIVEEADVVTHLFNLFHPVSRKEDSFSCRFQLNDDLLEQLTINRIQATERFIKYVDIGIVNDSRNVLDFLSTSFTYLIAILGVPFDGYM